MSGDMNMRHIQGLPQFHTLDGVMHVECTEENWDNMEWFQGESRKGDVTKLTRKLFQNLYVELAPDVEALEDILKQMKELI